MNKFILSAFADEASSDLDGQIKALKENNIPYLEVRGINGKNISEISILEAKEIKKKLDNDNLKIWSIGSPTGKIDINDNFTSHLDNFSHMVELGNILEADCYRLFSFYGTDGEEKYKDEVLRKLSLFVEKARGSGIVLCHENEKGIYGDVTKRCVEIHKNIPEIKAIFDFANFIQCDVNTLDAWKKLSQYVYYIHIKDALSDGSIVPAGKGVGNIQEILGKIQNRIPVILSIEPHLTIFDGLTELQEEGFEKIGKFEYKSEREAFDVAVNSLKKILTTLN